MGIGTGGGKVITWTSERELLRPPTLCAPAQRRSTASPTTPSPASASAPRPADPAGSWNSWLDVDIGKRDSCPPTQLATAFLHSSALGEGSVPPTQAPYTDAVQKMMSGVRDADSREVEQDDVGEASRPGDDAGVPVSPHDVAMNLEDDQASPLSAKATREKRNDDGEWRKEGAGEHAEGVPGPCARVAADHDVVGREQGEATSSEERERDLSTVSRGRGGEHTPTMPGKGKAPRSQDSKEEKMKDEGVTVSLGEAPRQQDEVKACSCTRTCARTRTQRSDLHSLSLSHTHTHSHTTRHSDLPNHLTASALAISVSVRCRSFFLPLASIHLSHIIPPFIAPISPAPRHGERVPQ